MADFKSNRPEFDRRFEKAIEKALELVGGECERLAKETISDMEAVDTGFLRNSITYAIEGEEPNIGTYSDDKGEKTGEYEGSAPKDSSTPRSVYIGSNVYYAPYVHYGTRRMVARPFLSQPIIAYQRELERLFEDAFQNFS